MKNFKKKVLNIVKKIPKGKVLSYKKVAQLAGSPRAWRAVGNILKHSTELSQIPKNKTPQIPCHRVIRSDGKLGGYNRGFEAKKKLLQKEKAI